MDQDPTAYGKALKLSKLQPYKDRLFPVLGRFGTAYETIEKEFDNWQYSIKMHKNSTESILD